MQLEVWKDINEYEGLYQVSNLGRIKSLKRNTAREKIMKPKENRDGYFIVNLCKNGNITTKKIHRLVAENFIPNPENKYSVNHINGIKKDNRIENLEWATASEQAKHAVKTGLWKWDDNRKIKLRNTLIEKGINPQKNSIHTKCHSFGVVKVIQKDDNGNIIKVWDSMSDASRAIGVPVSHIVRVCKGIRKHARGYVWSYYDQTKGGDM